MTIRVLVIDDELTRLPYKRVEFLERWTIDMPPGSQHVVEFEFISSQHVTAEHITNDATLAVQHVSASPTRWGLVLLDMQFDHGPLLGGIEPAQSDREFGLRIQSALEREFPTLPIVQFTAQLQDSLARQDGCYLSKLDGHPDDLRLLLVRHGRIGLLEKAALLRVPADTVVASEATVALYTRAFMLGSATSVTPILIRGETGTGKEHLARYLHSVSTRRHEPWVPIQVSAIPAGLFESELYGHEKGAFTGADRAHPGAFSRAGSGTLFLDEIGALPVELQSKLLRVIGERKFRRVGGGVDLDVNCAVCAATQDDLEANGSREDLLARFNVITIPPLRERPDEIPALARHFLEVIQAEVGKRGIVLSAAALDTLRAAPFRDNARGLRRALEHAVLSVSSQAVVQPSHLGELGPVPRAAARMADHVSTARPETQAAPSARTAAPGLTDAIRMLAVAEPPNTPSELLGLLSALDAAVSQAQRRLALAALAASRDPVRGKFRLGPTIQLLTATEKVTTTNARRRLQALLGSANDQPLDQVHLEQLIKAEDDASRDSTPDQAPHR
jgi:DNA-binding NtrC family response regulator